MIITSWLTALQARLFGSKKKASRTRVHQKEAANQATQGAESLEKRTLMTVNAINDAYNLPGLNEDDVFAQDAAGGVLANDPAGNGPRIASQVGTDPAFLLGPDGSFEFDPTVLPVLQTLPNGQSQNYLFQYAVSDNDGVGTLGFITLTVRGLNDATEASNATQSHGFTEDQGSAVALGAIVVSDIDSNEIVTATLSLSNSNAGTLAASGASFNSGVLTVTGSVTDVNNALAAVTFTPAADFDQDFTINVEISDGLEDGTVAATGTITMTAVAIPDIPTAADSTISINEDAPTYLGTLMGSDPDTNPPASLTFALTGTAATKGTVVITDPATGAFTYTAHADVNGTDTFQFQVTDETTLTSTVQTVTVNIAAVNDAPTFTAGGDESVLEETGAHVVSNWATNMSSGPITATDEIGQTLTFNVSNNNNSLFSVQPAIDASGNLTYTLAANAFGTAVVTVTLSDNGGTANGGDNTSDPQTFNITVTGINDAPSFSNIGNQTVLEDAAPQSVANWATSISAGPNEAGQVLTFNVTGNTNASLFSVQPAIAANGTLTYTLAPNANGSAVITVTLSDNGGTANGGVNTSASQNFTITATSVNDAPTFSVGADQTVLEDSGAQSAAGWATGITKGPITATDEIGQALTFNVTNNNNGLFSVQPAIDASGNLTYTLAANAFGTAVVTVTLSDNGGTANGGDNTSDPQTFNITVTGINDAPSFSNIGNQTVLEDAAPQSVANWATSISAGPNEAGQVLTFNVTGNTNASLFSVQPAIAANGTLTYTLAPNANGSAVITVTLSDNGGTANGGVNTSASQNFTITATPVNDAPAFSVGADQTVLEDTGAQSAAGWATGITKGPITATDEIGQALTFNVTNNNNSLFSVQPAIDASGNLTYTLAANAFGTAVVTVTLSDNGGTANGGDNTSDPQTFNITVTGINDAPSFSNIGNQTVLEDAAPQSVANWATSISAGPNEAGQNLTFNVIGNTNSSLFSVQPSIAANGTLTYTLAPNANGSAVITVTLSDNGGTANGGVNTSASQNFTITATAVNDAPAFSVGADQTVLEDTGAQSAAGWATGITKGPITATDEIGQTLTFNVSNNNNSLFSVQPAIDASGNLTYTLAANAFGTAVVTVTLSDNGGTANGGDNTSDPQTFNITVTGINDAPSFSNIGNQTVLEDATPQSVANWATSISAGPNEAGQALTFNVIGNTNSSLFSVQPAIAANGTLTYTLAPNANGSAVITVTLSDNGGTANGGVNTSASQNFTITATPVNDAPAFSVGADQTDLEDTGVQSVDGWATGITKGPITATDEIGQTLTFNVTNNNNSLFSVQPAINASGNLTYTLAANAFGTAVVTVTLSDNGGTANGGDNTSDPQTFNITVTGINDAPSFNIAGNQAILEDAGPQTSIGYASAISSGPANEASQTLTFTVTTSNDSLFIQLPSIDPLTGTLSYETAPNANGNVTITVTLSDNGGTANGGDNTSDSQSFLLQIIPVNDVPVAIDDSAVTNEDQTVTINVLANDDDLDGDPLEIFVNAPSHGSVLVHDNGTSGDFTDDFLHYTPDANFNGTDTFSYLVTDHNGGLASAVVTVTVNAVNDPPTFVTGADESVLEDSGAQTVNGWASGITQGPTSDENSQLLTFTVTNDNNSLFSVQPAIDASGNLTYTLAVDASGTAVVTVTLSDDGGTANGGDETSDAQTFNISVIGINDAPSFSSGGNQTVVEDAAPQSVANWATSITAGTNEAGQTLTFNVIGNSNPGLFSIQPAIAADGTLTYTLAPDANGAAVVTVTLSDNGGTANGGIDTSASQQFTIIATPVNDAPSFVVGPDVVLSEDAGPQTLANWATSLSSGPNDEFGQTRSFEVVAADPSLFSVQPAIHPVTGQLTFTPAPNANGTTLVTITLHDNGGLSNGGVDSSVPVTVNVTITSVNDAPTFVAGANQTVQEDAGAQTIAGWASSIFSGATNETNQILSFSVTAQDPTLFSVQPAVDPLTGDLTFTPVPNANGATLVTVTLHDNGGILNGGVDSSSSQTFNIQILAVNDTPSFVPGANQTTVEDSGTVSINAWASEIVKGPSDESGQNVTFTVTANDPSLFSIQPTIDPITGTLTFTPASNQHGTTSVTFALSDDGGGLDTSSSQTFNITILSANDAPTFSLPASPNQAVTEDTSPQTITGFATGISRGPTDEAGQDLEFQVTSDNNTLFSTPPAIDPATGNLTYTLASHANGVAVVTVTLQDDGGTAHGGIDTSVTRVFVISVSPVNDAPSFTKGANQTIAEDAGVQTLTGWATDLATGPASATDEASQTLEFVVTNNNNALFTTQPTIAADGTLTYTAAPNANGTATVSVQVRDNGGTAGGGIDTSGVQTFTITVTPLNDAPIAVDATVSLPEHSATGTIVGTIVATDVDAGDTKTFAITGGNTGGTFAINSVTGQITISNNTLLDFETTPVFHLVITVTDSANATDTAALTVNLTNVEDPLVLSFPSPIQNYVVRGGVIVIDPAATAVDQDTPNISFSGGTLRVTNIGTGVTDSSDRIGVLHQGTGSGNILVSGSKVYFESMANQIGNITAGRSGGPLTISLTSGATQTAVNALLRALSFRNTSDSPKLGQRNLQIELTNASGTENASTMKAVNVVNGRLAPVITLPGAALNYSNASSPLTIDAGAIVTDPDSPNFNGGRLNVNITQGVNTNNRLSVLSVGGITLSGRDVLFNGTKIGRMTVGSNSLSITFSSTSATPTAVQALTRAIAFNTVSANTSLADRVLQFSLTDGDGGSSAIATKTIHIGSQNS